MPVGAGKKIEYPLFVHVEGVRLFSCGRCITGSQVLCGLTR